MSSLEDILKIKYPIIQAPMFLVSNTAMVIEAMKCGIAGCIPALNYRTLEELRAALRELKAAKPEGGAFGFNLIVNKSNVKYRGQLEVICEEGCDFIITSLGSPEETIKEAHKVGIKVFCDVVDLKFAKKVEDLGADALTVAPYMGEDSVTPFLEYPDKWVILLALTSNPGSSDFQLLKTAGVDLYEEVLRKSQKWGTVDQLMFVIGATHPDSFRRIREIVPEHFFLVPLYEKYLNDLKLFQDKTNFENEFSYM